MGDKIVIVGDYGSGKTEFALNYSLHIASKGKVALADLDIVNPYFRSREATELLEERGVEVVYSRQLRNADLPALSPRIDSVLAGAENVIMDVGGDDGSIVLGRYRAQLERKKAQIWQVANCSRPFTSDVSGIMEAAQRIKGKSGLDITGLINNTNLGRETDVEMIKQGAQVVEQAAKEMNVPLLFHCARPHLLPELQEFGSKLFAMELSLFPADIT